VYDRRDWPYEAQPEGPLIRKPTPGRVKHSPVGRFKYAPEILIGFGNLLPRSSRHFPADFEAGVAFQDSPNATLNLVGNTCVNSPVTGCSPINSNSSVQANILAEQNKINNALAPFRYYPVVRVNFGYKF
jgi:hypothetical protein